MHPNDLEPKMIFLSHSYAWNTKYLEFESPLIYCVVLDLKMCLTLYWEIKESFA